MADFLTSLWESVFTPGPTPTLLIATNAAFGTLQVLLLVLLFFTRSIHFVILSFLCAGLWYGINWFTTELQAAQAKEAAEEARRQSPDPPRDTLGQKKKRRSPEPGPGSDTETETQQMPPPPKSETPRKQPPASVLKKEPSGVSSASSASGTLLEPVTNNKGMGDSDLLRRRRSLGESGYISTDSEWEKVSEGEAKSK